MLHPDPVVRPGPESARVTRPSGGTPRRTGASVGVGAWRRRPARPRPRRRTDADAAAFSAEERTESGSNGRLARPRAVSRTLSVSSSKIGQGAGPGTLGRVDGLRESRSGLWAGRRRMPFPHTIPTMYPLCPLGPAQDSPRVALPGGWGRCVSPLALALTAQVGSCTESGRLAGSRRRSGPECHPATHTSNLLRPLAAVMAVGTRVGRRVIAVRDLVTLRLPGW